MSKKKPKLKVVPKEPVPLPAECCMTCKFYLFPDKFYLFPDMLCRRFPPQMAATGYAGKEVWAYGFPKMNPEGVFGEFKNKGFQ